MARPIISSSNQRAKLFEGLILPRRPSISPSLNPVLEKYFGDVEDYLLRLATKVGAAFTKEQFEALGLDRLVTVTDADTTPDTLYQKVVSTDGSILIRVLNPGGDEELDLSVATMSAHGYVRVTGNNAAKNYIDQRDWRGRGLEVWGACQQGNAAAVEAVGTWLTGWNFLGNIAGTTYAGADQQLFLSGGGGNVRVWIETGTGKLYVTSDTFAAEFQFKYLIIGRPTDVAATLTI